MHVSAEVEQIIQQKLTTGRFSSADQLLLEALHLLDEEERFIDLKKEELRQQISEGLDSLRRGEGADGEEIFDQIEASLEAGNRTAR